MKTLTVRNKNAMEELLAGDADFDRISIASGLDQDEQTKRIVKLAQDRGIKVESTPIRQMDKRRSGETREVILGHLKPTNVTTLKDLLGDIYARDEYPFFLLMNRVDFDTNIGVIARTAFGAGVNGIIFQDDVNRFLNNDTIHFSIGAIARIPLVKMNMFDALKQLDKNGIPSYCLQMDAPSLYDEDLSGPAAFVLGAEATGVSDEVASRCTKQISIPMKEGIDSLNVGISAGVVMYEKIRQDRS